MPVQHRADPRWLAVCLAWFLWAHAAIAQLPAGSWSARSSTGAVFMGTYTAQVDAASGAVIGEWSLFDAGGLEVARGGWSAAKAASTWRGSWRSIATGSTRERAGTFDADLRTPATAPLRDLFVQALADVVRGTWRTGPYTGTWAIRATTPQ